MASGPVLASGIPCGQPLGLRGSGGVRGVDGLGRRAGVALLAGLARHHSGSNRVSAIPAISLAAASGSTVSLHTRTAMLCPPFATHSMLPDDRDPTGVGPEVEDEERTA